jgi:stage II sporulation protein D
VKRWLGALGALLFAVGIVLPLLAPPPPLAPQLTPERAAQPEPVVSLTRKATGEALALPIEEYVVGVVAAEMDGSFPPAALAAQAILARTYSLRLVRMGVKLTDDPGSYQAYDPSRITESIRQAVASTRGQVVVHSGELVDAVFHACSGGRTATASEGMQAPDKQYLRPVADPPCPQNETWSVRVPATALGAAAGVPGAVYSVAVGRKGPSGRALTLRVNGKEVSAFHVRSAVGSMRMKSTYVTDLRLEGRQVYMAGRGFGHGVGLSQWGAAALAQKGFTPAEIIGHYFMNVAIETWW